MRVLLSFMLCVLLSGCLGAETGGVNIPLVQYSQEFQDQLKREKNEMGPPCPTDVVIKGCSAAHRAILDYHDTRNMIRENNE